MLNRNHTEEFLNDAYSFIDPPQPPPYAKYPVPVMKYGRDAKLFDYDNNAFTDYTLAHGALFFGHSPSNVLRAAKKYTEQGPNLGALTRPAIDLAGLLSEHIVSIEKTYFYPSDIEAQFAAIQVARRYTDRDKVIVFDACRSTPLIRETLRTSVLVLPYNHPEALNAAFQNHHGTIAGVIIEPVATGNGVMLPRPEFLQTLRDWSMKEGALLIFDESRTGFRKNFGGAQSEFNIIPDLTCLGGMLGGGFPLAALGGKAIFMEDAVLLGPSTPSHAILRASYASLRLLNASILQKLNAKSEFFVRDVNSFFENRGFPTRIAHFGSMFHLPFNETEKADPSADMYSKLWDHLLENGIFFPTSGQIPFFISTVHSKKDLQKLAHLIKIFFMGAYHRTP